MANYFRAIVFSVAVFVYPLLLTNGAKGADPVESDTEASAQVSACAKCAGCKDAASHCQVRTTIAEEVGPAGTPASPSTRPKQVTHVMFNILVVQDTSESFREFVELQQSPFMMADTQMIRGTLRILEKNKLIKKLARPQMIVTVGTEGTLDVSRASSDESERWQGLQLKLLANELRGGLSVDFELERHEGETTNDVKTSMIVPTGQSVVLTAGPQAKDKSRVYVVLMPEIVKMPVERTAMIPSVRDAKK